jgi:hypothetical protein
MSNTYSTLLYIHNEASSGDLDHVADGPQDGNPLIPNIHVVASHHSAIRPLTSKKFYYPPLAFA